MTTTRTLWDLQVGDEVVVRDSVGWSPRYQLTRIEKVTKQSLQIPKGIIYMKGTGKIKTAYSSMTDRLLLPEEPVDIGGHTVPAREAVGIYREHEREVGLRTEYTRYIIEQGYNKLMRLDAPTLKEVATLLGYKDIGG